MLDQARRVVGYDLFHVEVFLFVIEANNRASWLSWSLRLRVFTVSFHLLLNNLIRQIGEKCHFGKALGLVFLNDCQEGRINTQTMGLFLADRASPSSRLGLVNSRYHHAQIKAVEMAALSGPGRNSDGFHREHTLQGHIQSLYGDIINRTHLLEQNLPRLLLRDDVSLHIGHNFCRSVDLNQIDSH